VLRAAASDFPGDGGLIVALLMNLVTLRRGEGLFAPAGVLHAYQSGLGVELMAASDNVMRGGLTPKHVDVPELLHVLDATPAPAPVIRPRPLADGVDVYDTPWTISLERVTVAGDTVRVAVHGPAIALCTVGEVVVRCVRLGGSAPEQPCTSPMKTPSRSPARASSSWPSPAPDPPASVSAARPRHADGRA
jgi:mannose-6-phosphate isomerase